MSLMMVVDNNPLKPVYATISATPNGATRQYKSISCRWVKLFQINH
jgi:predicted secreted protein